jgi:hypothetical protein
MRRLRPIFVISTWRTPAGNATGLGKRTAWLRLVVNTVERAINAPHIGISLKGFLQRERTIGSKNNFFLTMLWPRFNTCFSGLGLAAIAEDKRSS